ncbi:MAG: DUF4062 domain-containing protein [bacterium]|nr:DUF4062 domain-containing protein [bacterium]
MGKKLEELRIFVASPNDVTAERNLAVEIINEVNANVARSKGLTLLPLTGDDAESGFGKRAEQVILDRINMGEIDIFVGIMWRKFGSATGDTYESGTEEEFHVAYDQWKVRGAPRIMFYFNNFGEMPSSTTQLQELGKVLSFKEKIGEKGLYREFKGENEFKDLFRKELTNIILDWGGGEPETVHTDLNINKCGYFDTWRDAFTDKREGGERVESYLYKSANSIVKFMTISGRSVSSGDVEEALKTKGIDFRFKLLLFDWNSPHFEKKMRDERRGSQSEIDRAAEKACNVAKDFLKMGEAFEIDLEVRLYSEYPVWRLMIIDNETAYIGYYPKGKRGYEGPMFIHPLNEDGSLFYPVNQYFDKLWVQSGPSLNLGDPCLN